MPGDYEKSYSMFTPLYVLGGGGYSKKLLNNKKYGTLHKQQNNIEDYSYYLNKVRIDEKDYLIRFTVQNMRHKPWKEQIHILHSQQLSQINKSGASNVSTLTMWADEVAASDLRLSNLLRTVN